MLIWGRVHGEANCGARDGLKKAGRPWGGVYAISSIMIYLVL